jgi:hypothetical protein
MKTGIISLGVGVLTEALLVFVLLVSGGIGPCGPGSTTGAVILWIHAPGFLLTNAWGLPDQATIILVPISYVLLWTIITYAFLCAKEERKV